MSALGPIADISKVTRAKPLFLLDAIQIIDKRKDTPPYHGFGIREITVGCLIGIYRERLIAITPDRHLSRAMSFHLLPSVDLFIDNIRRKNAAVLFGKLR